jgi:hypothetical protein
MMYVPVTPLAIGVADVATPLEFVTAVNEVLTPNVALAPEDGAAKVTVTPATGFDETSVTWT